MSDTPACYAVIPAAGVGTRMGESVPKQYLKIGDFTVLEHSLRALLACPDIRYVAVPLHPQDALSETLDLLRDPRVVTTTGASERSGSVLAGLQQLTQYASEQDWVLVHDAARPCLRQSELANLIATVTRTGVGGLLAEPVVDTVKRVDENSSVVATLDRSQLWRAQTPQMFRLGELMQALEAAQANGDSITDEASAMELAGHAVQVVEGVPGNLKVTLPRDLALAQWYLAQESRRDNASE